MSYYYPAVRELPMSEEEFRLLRDFVRQQFGLFYDDSKSSLLKNRLLPRVTALGLASFDEYYHYLRFNPARAEELRKMVSHLTNNETYFFREMKQLDAFSNILLPAARDKRKSVVRILSAGCSTGEEPYTLSILAQEKLGLLPGVKLEIVGIDVDEKVLEKARAAQYFKNSFRATDPLMIHRHFQSQGESKIVRESVRKPIQFVWANLVDEKSFRPLGKFDIILCRNVLIYFQDETIRKVIENLSSVLEDDGVLLLGHSESLVRITDSFEAERHPGAIVYRKVLF
jgi:chemotaxis protein methyltransferase CheR